MKSGKTSRGQLVGINNFVRYLCEMDGEDPTQRKKDIMDLLREINGGERVKKDGTRPAAPAATA